ncbi:MAG: peptidase U32 family protein, partial [Butyricicoccaceae bacterium]
MTELLAPAGSIPAVHAAVQNGANAVYMGFGAFNARRGAKNFTAEEIAEAIAYCRLRGVKTHITVNTLVSDRELPQLLRDVETVYRAGADALIVQDLGAARAIR